MKQELLLNYTYELLYSMQF